jgi:hypothetical protein
MDQAWANTLEELSLWDMDSLRLLLRVKTVCLLFTCSSMYNDAPKPNDDPMTILAYIQSQENPLPHLVPHNVFWAINGDHLITTDRDEREENTIKFRSCLWHALLEDEKEAWKSLCRLLPSPMSHSEAGTLVIQTYWPKDTTIYHSNSQIHSGSNPSTSYLQQEMSYNIHAQYGMNHAPAQGALHTEPVSDFMVS